MDSINILSVYILRSSSHNSCRIYLFVDNLIVFATAASPVDELGIEPRTFSMQTKYDTPTPLALIGSVKR